MTPTMRHHVLLFAALAEIGTGLALLADPALVVRLLLGEPLAGVAAILGRCFGVALVGLGMACWPQASRIPLGVAPRVGMAVYNALIALYLAYLGAVAHMSGSLLWPVVLLHVLITLLLLWPDRDEPMKRTTIR